jgi:hypothetical protein
MKYDNTTLDEAKDLFRVASKIMQKHVIGYIKVAEGVFEPAVSDHESFMPLNSFGTSNTFMFDRFIPFPDNKTLSDMLQNPIEFDKWCKENLK